MSMRIGMAAVAVGAFILGGVAMQILPAAHAQDKENKKPKWVHGMNLSVRKADEPYLGKDTKKVGVEVFRDEYNGNLIYVSDAGSIAVVPAK
jgi:hypothetical protein